jgi:small subunit ribosomal protein S16e
MIRPSEKKKFYFYFSAIDWFPLRSNKRFFLKKLIFFFWLNVQSTEEKLKISLFYFVHFYFSKISPPKGGAGAAAAGPRERKRVQTFGKKKTSTAVCTVRRCAQSNIKVNGIPINCVQPAGLRSKVMEAVTIVGSKSFSRLKFDVTVRGGGQVSQAYAARQAIAKGMVAYLQKYSNEVEKSAVKTKYLAFDRTLLVADDRRAETKKAGRHSARSRFTKSYR